MRGNQRLSRGMTTASGSFIVENNGRMNGMPHLALSSFHLKGQLTSRASSDKKYYCDRKQDR